MMIKLGLAAILKFPIDFEDGEWTDNWVGKDEVSCLKSAVTGFKSKVQSKVLDQNKLCKT